MNAYKELNPDFKINFIHYNVTEIENIYFNNYIETKYDELLLNSINEILNSIKKYRHTLYRTLLDGQRIYYHNELRFIQLLADIYRLEILNEFGGIYLDCDTYPLKKFDDKLLEKSFIVQTYINTINNNKVFSHVISDNYFIGLDKNIKLYNYKQDNIERILQTNDKWWISIDYLMNKRNFFLLKLSNDSIRRSNDFYIEHYCDGNWKNKNGKIRTPLCRLDNIYNEH